MPQYSFKCSCGAKKTVVRPMAESDMPVLCDVCSFVMKRDFVADFGKDKKPAGWPMVSVAAGINPDQIGEYKEFDKKMGVETDYTPSGDVVFRDRAHRKKYCEAHHLYDRNGGYGDPQRRSF